VATLTFDAFWRDHGAAAGLKGLSKEAREAAKRQDEFKKQATVAGAVVGAALVKVGADAIRMASDTAESSSKVGVVFGKSAEAIRRSAESSAKSMGISKAAYLDAAGTLGNLFVSLKLPQAEASKMSTKMLGLASDMASFNNADPSEVLEALRSGLVGETEPLRRFGVNINEAAVKAEAMSLGLVKASTDTEKIRLAQMRAEVAQRNYAKAIKDHGKDSDEARKALVTLTVAQNSLDKATAGTIPDLNAAQKAQATYSLITKQTTTAQGDFARTSDGLANQQRILKAQFSDLQGELGQKLLPAAVATAGALGDLLTFIDDHKQGVTIAAGAVAALVVGVKGLNAASTAVDSWRNLASAIGGARDAAGGKGKGAIGSLGKLGTLVGASGPWGLAIAGGAAALGVFAAAQATAKQRSDELRDSLDKETGATTELSRARIFQTLQQRGAVDAAKLLGVSLRDLTDAAMGNSDAQAAVNAQLEAARARYGTSGAGVVAYSRNVTAVKQALSLQNTELAKERDKLLEARQAGIGATETTGDHADAVHELRRELAKLPRDVSVTVGAEVRYPKDWKTYRAGERMATGGQVGDGIGSVDDVPALLTRGEHVWTTREVQAAGGHAAMYRMRKAALAGQKFATGGAVGLTRASARSVVDEVGDDIAGIAQVWAKYLQRQLDAVTGGGSLGGTGWRRQWAAVHAAFPWAQLTSSYRPGAITVSGNRSYHALGRAIDVSPSMEIFDWIRGHYGSTSKELIYSPAGARQIKNGRAFYYGEPVRSGHWCVPLDVEILTRRGWLPYDQVAPGVDETLGFNAATGRTEWTRVLEVSRFEDAEVFEARARGWAVRATADHRWISHDTTTGRYGWTTTNAPGRKTWQVAAPMASGDGLPITLDEAELLGWLATDGGQHDGIHHRGVNFSLHVWQTKPAGVARLREILGESAAWNGKGFRLANAYARDLMARARLTHVKDADELLAAVFAMDEEQRHAMLRGVVAGDGTVTKLGAVSIYQDAGPLCDLMATLAYLCGHRVVLAKRTFTDRRKRNGVNMQIRLGRARATTHRQGRRSLGHMPVWCPTTENGSWTARFDGQPVLTGNSHVHWAYDQGGVASGAGWIPKVTSAPERVLSPRQTVAFERLVSNPAATGSVTVNQQFVAPNYVGSRLELRDALVDLAKSGLLDVILKGRY
jgi:hypothetical protein